MGRKTPVRTMVDGVATDVLLVGTGSCPYGRVLHEQVWHNGAPTPRPDEHRAAACARERLGRSLSELTDPRASLEVRYQLGGRP